MPISDEEIVDFYAPAAGIEVT